ncbi:MAG: hypothetical protein K8H89_09490 [Flavobacteriales bacterium]|jgi:hypothetical protein|nr:hypothetical protein [Flavobacteriales bacterium]
MVAGPVVVLGAIVLEAFPYLAITEPSGGKVLVVEGWMEPGALKEAAKLALDSGYTTVYTTGTIRPFAHYLGPAEGVTVELQDPFRGEMAVHVSGTTGAGFLLIAGGDTLLNQLVTPVTLPYHGSVHQPVDRIRVVAWDIALAEGTPAIFVRSLTIDGLNINFFQQRSWFTYPDDAAEPAWPTFAQSARSQLVDLGVPAERIIAVPAYGMPRSRSWGNAHAFGTQARQDGITAFDVATVGVHARRSRDLFRTACGPSVRVGVIALTDPFCTRDNWWRSYRGWLTMLKEVVGASEAQAVEFTR